MSKAKHVVAGISVAVARAGCDVDADMAESGPAVTSESDLTHLEGARAGQAEMNITNQGYQLVRSDGLTNYWFNPANGAWAAITSSDGRCSNIDMLPSGDCRSEFGRALLPSFGRQSVHIKWSRQNAHSVHRGRRSPCGTWRPGPRAIPRVDG